MILSSIERRHLTRYSVWSITKANLFNEAIWARNCTFLCLDLHSTDWRTNGRIYVNELVDSTPLHVQSSVTTRRYMLRWFFLRVSVGVGPTQRGSSLCINPTLLPSPAALAASRAARGGGAARQRGGSPSIISKWRIALCCLYENNRQQSCFVTHRENTVRCCLVDSL